MDSRWEKAESTAKAVKRIEECKASKGDYKKMTITVPPEMYARIIDLMAERKKKGDGGDGVSGVVREAIAKFLD